MEPFVTRIGDVTIERVVPRTGKEPKDNIPVPSVSLAKRGVLGGEDEHIGDGISVSEDLQIFLKTPIGETREGKKTVDQSDKVSGECEGNSRKVANKISTDEEGSEEESDVEGEASGEMQEKCDSDSEAQGSTNQANDFVVEGTESGEKKEESPLVQASFSTGENMGTNIKEECDTQPNTSPKDPLDSKKRKASADSGSTSNTVKKKKQKLSGKDDKDAPEKHQQSKSSSSSSSSSSETDENTEDHNKPTMERKVSNLRRNIREVMNESQLDEETLAAQRQEMERLRRVQEQQRIIREVQRQIALNRQNTKTQTRVISLLQGNSSILKQIPGTSGSPGTQVRLPNTVLVKLASSSGSNTATQNNKKVFELLRVQKGATGRGTSPVGRPGSVRTVLGKSRTPGQVHMMTPSVSIAPVMSSSRQTEPGSESESEAEGSDKDAMARAALRKVAGKPKGKDVVTISSSSDDDDCILLSEPSSGDEAEPVDDPTNSGMHTNDLYNVPDEQGRVLVNVGHPPEDQDIFLAPQIARVIKPHQIGGVRFLYDNVVESLERFNTSTGFGCILAHSMGLGKTLQVVSFCDVFLRHTKARTVLCIMPINTLQNWLAEFNMWLPDKDPQNSPLAVHGEVRPRDFPLHVLNDSHKSMAARCKVIQDWNKDGGVLLIGYELYRQLSLKRSHKSKKKRKKPSEIVDVDEEDKNKALLDEIHSALVKPGPDLVICDEGHRIKNSHASISQALKQIRSKRRVVLTGYPLQNNLLEYWCMVDFVRPNYLGTKTEFCNMFERPIQNGQCIDSTPQDIRLMRYRAHVLHSLLEGFVQRRSHSVLQVSLPQKEEYVLLLRMNSFQRKLYDTFMNEVVRTKAVPNPLKAFAVCCKIWNHPDVLYYFLKKRAGGEDVDLDLEEATASTTLPVAGNGSPRVAATKRGRGRGSRTGQAKREKKVLTPLQISSSGNKPAATIVPNNTNLNVDSPSMSMPPTGVGGIAHNPHGQITGMGGSSQMHPQMQHQQTQGFNIMGQQNQNQTYNGGRNAYNLSYHQNATQSAGQGYNNQSGYGSSSYPHNTNGSSYTSMDTHGYGGGSHSGYGDCSDPNTQAGPPYSGTAGQVYYPTNPNANQQAGYGSYYSSGATQQENNENSYQCSSSNGSNYWQNNQSSFYQQNIHSQNNTGSGNNENQYYSNNSSTSSYNNAEESPYYLNQHQNTSQCYSNQMGGSLYHGLNHSEGFIDNMGHLRNARNPQNQMAGSPSRIGGSQNLMGPQTSRMRTASNHINSLQGQLNQTGNQNQMMNQSNQLGNPGQLGSTNHVGSSQNQMSNTGHMPNSQNHLPKACQMNNSNQSDNPGQMGNPNQMGNSRGHLSETCQISNPNHMENNSQLGSSQNHISSCQINNPSHMGNPNHIGSVNQVENLENRINNSNQVGNLQNQINNINQVGSMQNQMNNPNHIGNLQNQIANSSNQMGSSSQLGSSQNKMSSSSQSQKGSINQMGNTQNQMGNSQSVLGNPSQIGSGQNQVVNPNQVGNSQNQASNSTQIGNSQNQIGNPNQIGNSQNQISTPNQIGNTTNQINNANQIGNAQNQICNAPQNGNSQNLMVNPNQIGSGQNSMGNPHNQMGNANQLMNPQNQIGNLNQLGSSQNPLGNSNQIGSAQNQMGNSNQIGNPQNPVGNLQNQIGSPNLIGNSQNQMVNPNQMGNTNQIVNAQNQMGNPSQLPTSQNPVQNSLSQLGNANSQNQITSPSQIPNLQPQMSNSNQIPSSQNQIGSPQASTLQNQISSPTPATSMQSQMGNPNHVTNGNPSQLGNSQPQICSPNSMTVNPNPLGSSPSQLCNPNQVVNNNPNQMGSSPTQICNSNHMIGSPTNQLCNPNHVMNVNSNPLGNSSSQMCNTNHTNTGNSNQLGSSHQQNQIGNSNHVNNGGLSQLSSTQSQNHESSGSTNQTGNSPNLMGNSNLSAGNNTNQLGNSQNQMGSPSQITSSQNQIGNSNQVTNSQNQMANPNQIQISNPSHVSSQNPMSNHNLMSSTQMNNPNKVANSQNLVNSNQMCNTQNHMNNPNQIGGHNQINNSQIQIGSSQSHVGNSNLVNHNQMSNLQTTVESSNQIGNTNQVDTVRNQGQVANSQGPMASIHEPLSHVGTIKNPNRNVNNLHNSIVNMSNQMSTMTNQIVNTSNPMGNMQTSLGSLNKMQMATTYPHQLEMNSSQDTGTASGQHASYLGSYRHSELQGSSEFSSLEQPYSNINRVGEVKSEADMCLREMGSMYTQFQTDELQGRSNQWNSSEDFGTNESNTAMKPDVSEIHVTETDTKPPLKTSSPSNQFSPGMKQQFDHASSKDNSSRESSNLKEKSECDEKSSETSSSLPVHNPVSGVHSNLKVQPTKTECSNADESQSVAAVKLESSGLNLEYSENKLSAESNASGKTPDTASTTKSENTAVDKKEPEPVETECSHNKSVSTGTDIVEEESKDVGCGTSNMTDCKQFSDLGTNTPKPFTKDDIGIPYDWATELLKNYVPGSIENSAKMEVFFCILEESMALGDRMLVFSQSLFTLNLIEDFLQRTNLPGRQEKWARNWNYYRLDGSTSALEREKLINEYNSNPNIHLFLVSTRAGSLGINLVGANRVVVFDASWNPCHDTQAVCRVYRYGQKKPCFVYRLVMDNCLEKKIYDRQINKQGMADRVVDECNPDAHLSIKEVTNLCWDNEEETEVRDFSKEKEKYIDVVMQKVLDKYSAVLSKEPFQHESLLVDRKEKKLSQAEKRLAKRSYELEKQANINYNRPQYTYYPSPGVGNTGVQTSLQIRAIRTDANAGNTMPKPVASVRPMQAELSTQMERGPRSTVSTVNTGRSRWIPADVWQRQGMSAQEMTLPLDVVIPTNSPDRASIVLKAGQRVMVLKSPKGIYMQLENGKIIAIRTAFKVGGAGKGAAAQDYKATAALNADKADMESKLADIKKESNISPVNRMNTKVSNVLPLKNNSAITIIPKNSPATNMNRPITNVNKFMPKMSGTVLKHEANMKPWGSNSSGLGRARPIPGKPNNQPTAEAKPYFHQNPVGRLNENYPTGNQPTAMAKPYFHHDTETRGNQSTRSSISDDASSGAENMASSSTLLPDEKDSSSLGEGEIMLKSPSPDYSTTVRRREDAEQDSGMSYDDMPQHQENQSHNIEDDSNFPAENNSFQSETGSWQSSQEHNGESRNFQGISLHTEENKSLQGNSLNSRNFQAFPEKNQNPDQNTFQLPEFGRPVEERHLEQTDMNVIHHQENSTESRNQDMKMSSTFNPKDTTTNSTSADKSSLKQYHHSFNRSQSLVMDGNGGGLKLDENGRAIEVGAASGGNCALKPHNYQDQNLMKSHGNFQNSIDSTPNAYGSYEQHTNSTQGSENIVLQNKVQHKNLMAQYGDSTSTPSSVEDFGSESKQKSTKGEAHYEFDSSRGNNEMEIHSVTNQSPSLNQPYLSGLSNQVQSNSQMSPSPLTPNKKGRTSKASASNSDRMSNDYSNRYESDHTHMKPYHTSNSSNSQQLEQSVPPSSSASGFGPTQNPEDQQGSAHSSQMDRTNTHIPGYQHIDNAKSGQQSSDHLQYVGSSYGQYVGGPGYYGFGQQTPSSMVQFGNPYYADRQYERSAHTQEQNPNNQEKSVQQNLGRPQTQQTSNTLSHKKDSSMMNSTDTKEIKRDSKPSPVSVREDSRNVASPGSASGSRSGNNSARSTPAGVSQAASTSESLVNYTTPLSSVASSAAPSNFAPYAAGASTSTTGLPPHQNPYESMMLNSYSPATCQYNLPGSNTPGTSNPFSSAAANYGNPLRPTGAANTVSPYGTPSAYGSSMGYSASAANQYDSDYARASMYSAFHRPEPHHFGPGPADLSSPFLASMAPPTNPSPFGLPSHHRTPHFPSSASPTAQNSNYYPQNVYAPSPYAARPGYAATDPAYSVAYGTPGAAGFNPFLNHHLHQHPYPPLQHPGPAAPPGSQGSSSSPSQ